MKIYTSYFANLRNIPDSIVRISIAAKTPEFFKWIQYKKVAPKYGFFMEWKKNKDNNFYIEHYQKEVLDTLNPENVYKDLENLSGGRDCVLLCYEKPESFCHRHLFADWLGKNLNIEVKEWSK